MQDSRLFVVEIYPFWIISFFNLSYITFWLPPIPCFNTKIVIGGIKYKKYTIRNQSIIEKNISSLMGPKILLGNNKHFLKRVDFWKPVNYIMVDWVIFDNP